jgi:peptidyl-prolyl cis-trans isomerase SurA
MGDRMILRAAFAVTLAWAAACGFLPLATPAQAQSIDVQSIEAIVNDKVISAYDVDQRLNLILSTINVQITPEQRQFLRRQALQNLIDEKLQIQEAERYDLIISKEEIKETLVAVAQQYRMTLPQFEANLKSSGVDISTLESQVEAEIAWSRLVRGRYQQQITVSDDEVQDVIDRMEKVQGQSEYLLSEIYLIIDVPAREPEIKQTAERIVAQLKSGTPFQAMARQFSEASTAARGGDLGWVQEGHLASELEEVLKNMRVNELSDPIKTPGGYYILLLRDRRTILGADPSQARLSLHQYLFEKNDGESPEDVRARATRAVARIRGCEALPKAADLGAKEDGRLADMTMGDLPPDVQRLLEDVEVGSPSAPLLVEEGARVLVLCDKVMPEASVPSFEAVSESLTQQRLSMIARRYLRDLRRDAIIDYR